MTYESASNALVATVGFYTSVLSDLMAKFTAVEKRVNDLELQRNQFAIANAKLTTEDAAARRVIELARVYCTLVSPPGPPEDALEVALANLISGIGQYDDGR